MNILDSRSEAVMAVKLAGLIEEEFCCNGRRWMGVLLSGAGVIWLCGYEKKPFSRFYLKKERRLTYCCDYYCDHYYSYNIVIPHAAESLMNARQ